MVTLTIYDWANVCLSGVSAEGHLGNDDVAQNAGDTCQAKINKDIHSWCSMDIAGQCQVLSACTGSHASVHFLSYDILCCLHFVW